MSKLMQNIHDGQKYKNMAQIQEQNCQFFTLTSGFHVAQCRTVMDPAFIENFDTLLIMDFCLHYFFKRWN